MYNVSGWYLHSLRQWSTGQVYPPPPHPPLSLYGCVCGVCEHNAKNQPPLRSLLPFKTLWNHTSTQSFNSFSYTVFSVYNYNYPHTNRGSHDGLGSVHRARLLTFLSIGDPELPVDLHHVRLQGRHSWQTKQVVRIRTINYVRYILWHCTSYKNCII